MSLSVLASSWSPLQLRQDLFNTSIAWSWSPERRTKPYLTNALLYEQIANMQMCESLRGLFVHRNRL